MDEEQYIFDDVVLPILAEQGRLRKPDGDALVCALEVRVTTAHVFLRIGPRDWQWDRATGEMLGAGTSLSCPPPIVAAVDATAAP